MYKISDPTLSLTTIHNGGKIVVVAGFVANFVAVFGVADVVALVLEMVQVSNVMRQISRSNPVTYHNHGKIVVVIVSVEAVVVAVLRLFL